MLHQSIIFVYWSMYFLNTRPQLMLNKKVSSYPTPQPPQLPYPLPLPYPNLKLLWDMSDTNKCHLTKPHLSYVSSFQRWIVVHGPRLNISTLTAGDVRVRNFGRPFMISLNHTSSNKGPPRGSRQAGGASSWACQAHRERRHTILLNTNTCSIEAPRAHLCECKRTGMPRRSFRLAELETWNSQTLCQ